MPWEELKKYKSANIFHTRPWIEFLADYFHSEPVVAAVLSEGKVVGYFTGQIINKFGFRILGSPFRGWLTYFMGFVLRDDVSYNDVLNAFPKFAFENLNCHFFMIMDTNIETEDLKGLSIHINSINHYALDLTKCEEELFHNFKNKYVRRSIRRAEKKGVVIEEATDLDFADEYYAQYCEVMRRQSLSPLYELDFVKQMIKRLLPTGNLLLLRARNTDGKCIATIIDLIFNKTAVGWGAASWKQYQNLNPNELMIWYEMRRLKEMGVEVLNLAGMKREFKQKFGAQRKPCIRLLKARNPLLFAYIYSAVSLSERIRYHRKQVKFYS